MRAPGNSVRAPMGIVRARGVRAAAPLGVAAVAWVALAIAGCGNPPVPADTRAESAVETGAGEGGSVVCAPGQTACNGACADLQSSSEHCGACGSTCAAGPHSTARCSAGVCRAQCAAGFADCNNDPRDGCEAELATSSAACGACGNACATAANATPTCAMATCGLACAEGFSDCDGAYESGCESDTASDRENCGACGRACPWPPRSDFSCGMSACQFACRRGYADCDRMMTNGCEVALVSARNCGSCGAACAGATPLCADTGARIECVASCPTGTMACDGACVDTRSNLENCGSCGTVCRGGSNAQPACVEGRCGLECRQGYADCDGDPSNGCEINLALNAQHCGACGNRCGSGPGGEGYCAAGVCRVRCQPGALDCDGNPGTGCEVNATSDQRNCGGCGRVCSSPANATALCNVGSCEFACEGGFGNCDGNAANGCETVLRSDPANCGACGNRCATGQSCIEGVCAASSCMPGRGECDGNPATACETDLFSAEEHCGACNARCVRPNALAECRMGGCQFDACIPGFGNCDGNRANGCETPIDTIENCGGCGVVCPATNGTPVCTDGRCSVLRCTGSFADCNNDARDGCETDVSSNARACGMCAIACAVGQRCVSGACMGIVVTPTDGGAGDAMMTGPEAGTGDAAMMGGETGTGSETSVGLDATVSLDAAPADAPVADAACPMGQMRCGGAMGACTDLQTDTANCGMCGRACGAGQVCTMGTCGCPAGQTLCGSRCVDTSGDTANCGMCDRACATGQSCTMGACTCPMGGTLCNGTCTVVASDNDNCGMCGRVCGARQSCNAGDCVCPTGETRCGTGASALCADTQTDNNNCGACGTRCTGGSTCVMGACQCPMGETRCGMGASAQCVNTQTDTANCGTCGTACPAGQVCNGGTCTLTCTAPRVACGSGAMMSCADTSSDDANCGMCGVRCGAVANASATLCSAGRCAALCESGFGNCDGMYANGCEADLATDTSNCGSCGASCPASAPNSTGIACVAGACQPVCAADTAMSRRRDCNNMLADGCEANLLTDLPNCGSCGNACPGTLPNASAVTCTGGSCTPTCNMNRGNCDGNNANGCETDTQTSTAHCGGCGMACPATLPNASAVTCVAAVCTPTCAMGRGNCDGNNANGCETDTQTSNTHCGACNNPCGMGQTCVSGMCTASSGASCRAIKMANPTAADGLYMVDPDGSGPLAAVQTYCDMTTNGGGWTLVQRTTNNTAANAPLLSNYATMRNTTLGAPTAGQPFRLAGVYWPALQSNGDHLFRFVPVRNDDTLCGPLYYRVAAGTWSFPMTGPASISGVMQTLTFFNMANVSTSDTGPSTSCVNSSRAAPWTYTGCCTVCPTFETGYWSAGTGRPMANQGVVLTPDLFSNTITNVCAGSASPPQLSRNYYAFATMDYFVR